MATFKNNQLNGYLATEEEIEKVAKLIAQDYLQASKQVRAEMQKIYSKYLAGIKPEDFYNTLIQYNRLENMLKEIWKKACVPSP